MVYKVQWHFSHLLSTLSVEPQLKANLQNHKKYQSFCLSSSSTDLPSSLPTHPPTLSPPSPAEPKNDDSKCCFRHCLLTTMLRVHPLPETPDGVCVEHRRGWWGGGGICYTSRLTKSHSPHNMTKNVRWLHLLPFLSALSLGEIESQSEVCTGTSSSTHNLLSLVPVSCVLKLGKETDHQTCNSTLREEGGEGGGGSGEEGEERRGGWCSGQ